MKNKKYCYALTITDLFSRAVLCVEALELKARAKQQIHSEKQQQQRQEQEQQQQQEPAAPLTEEEVNTEQLELDVPAGQMLESMLRGNFTVEEEEEEEDD